MTEKSTVDDVARWLKPFVKDGEVYELRILDCVDNPQYPPFTMAGYFDSDHLDDLAQAALLWTPKAVGVYVTLNPVNPDLLARAANRIIRATKTTRSTSDGDIVARRRLTIDFDPERPAGISSTDLEKVLASKLVRTVRADLHALGWPEPIEADSGNGYHLNYAVDLPAADGGLVERFLQALSALYTTPAVKVDTSLFNPSRIIKLYGTWSRKGDSIPTRPHRLSRVNSAPSFLTTVEGALIEAFIRENPLPAPEQKPSRPKPGSKAPVKGPPAGDIPDVDLRPGDDLEARADWINDILGPHGWTIDKELSNGEIRLTRPGKNGGTSATIGHNKGLHVFTDSKNAAPFTAGQNYSKLEAYCLLNHDGRYKNAIPALVQLGYGHYVDNDGEVKQNPPPPGWKREGRGNASQVNSPSSVADDPSALANPAPATSSVGFVGSFPQVSPITAALRPVPKLDERLLPDPFRSWIKDIAERACCPLDIPSISALVSVAAVVGRKVAIRPKRHDDWTVVPNLWGMGVLPPGWLKTHCLDEPKKPLARLEFEAREKHESALRDHAISEAVATAQTEAAKAALKERARKKGGATEAELRELASQTLTKSALAPPTLRRYIINDATVEKLGELLAENPNGLLLYRDELMGFLKGLEKQGHEGARAFYLEAWNGTGSYSYDRIERGSLYIPSNTVSLLGGIQPGKLAAYIRGAGSGENDDGLISRFQLAVYPDVDQPFFNVDHWPETDAKNQAHAVFEKLASLDPGSIGATVDAVGEIPYLRFANDAQGFFDEWRIDLETKVRSSREAANLTSHLAKYRSLMPSLALLFHLIEVVSGSAPGPVSRTSARRSAAWCQYLEEHARRIYQMAFDGDPEPAQRLGERLKSSLQNPFKARDVLLKGWKGLATKEEVDRAIAILEGHGWVVRQEIRTTPGVGGRPTEEFYINPAVLEGDSE